MITGLIAFIKLSKILIWRVTEDSFLKHTLSQIRFLHFGRGGRGKKCEAFYKHRGHFFSTTGRKHRLRLSTHTVISEMLDRIPYVLATPPDQILKGKLKPIFRILLLRERSIKPIKKVYAILFPQSKLTSEKFPTLS